MEESLLPHDVFYHVSMKRYAAVKVREGAGPQGRVPDGAGEGSSPLSPESNRPDAVLPRKEVIQPHVPVRLPCYDFTPLTLHTFDASAPEGFGRRLRVQTTRVV